MDILIAHVSDIHVGKINFLPGVLKNCIKEINDVNPDAVVITGDLTEFGFEGEYIDAEKYINQIRPETFIVPGNHDARYCGDIYFEKFFGYGNNVMRIAKNLCLIGIDTSIPDLDEGTVGRGKQRWLKNELAKIPKSHCKVVAMHHHLIPIPHTGRERSVLTDAGDILEILVDEGADLVLCGHRHTPFSWMINDVVVVTAGSASSRKLRAGIHNSYNLINITDEHIVVKSKCIGGDEKTMAKYRRTGGDGEYELQKI